jgi:hypothetical protein
MAKRKPTHAQAQLQLQLYDLRREARIRQAREWFMQNYFVDGIEDATRVTPPGSQEATYMAMVMSYWDQACALVNYGLLHEQFFFETSGEFYAAWDRIKPVVATIRERYHMKHWLANLERAASRYEKWVETQSPGVLDAMRQYTKQMRAAKAGQTAASKAAKAN